MLHSIRFGFINVQKICNSKFFRVRTERHSLFMHIFIHSRVNGGKPGAKGTGHTVANTGCLFILSVTLPKQFQPPIVSMAMDDQTNY